MVWIFSLLSLGHASYQNDLLKARICQNLRTFVRDLSVEACVQGKFKLTRRSNGILDFRWRLNKKLECFGTLYQDNGDIYIDGCAK